MAGKIVFIICEYNPFHNGHLYHLLKSKEAVPGAAVVCIMSGNFVQRGEAAILDKYMRAECAVRAGADLVLELPAPFSFGCAENFASAACLLAGGLSRAADANAYLSFGVSCAERDLETIACRLMTDAFAERLEQIRRESHGTMAYPLCVRHAYEDLWGSCPVLTEPNTILALEYIKALKRFQLPISVLPIMRSGAAHDSGLTVGNTASASYIRQSFRTADMRPYLPEYSDEMLKKGNLHDIRYAERVILHILREKDPVLLERAADVYGGYGAKLSAAARKAGTYDALIEGAKSKNYTDARLRRMILSCVLACEKEQMKEEPQYTLLLAASKHSTELLKRIKHGGFPVLTKPSDIGMLPARAVQQYAFAVQCDRFYALTAQKVSPYDDMMLQKPYIG